MILHIEFHFATGWDNGMMNASQEPNFEPIAEPVAPLRLRQCGFTEPVKNPVLTRSTPTECAASLLDRSQ